MTHVDLNQAIDDGRIVGLQVLVFALCTLALMLDGMDNQTLAVLGAGIARDWHLTARALGFVFTSASISAAIFGSMVGGTFADHIGRRGIIIGATAFYGVMTIFTATAANVDQLMIWRAMSGIGFGAVLPNALALLAEYWPLRHRAKIVCISLGGYALGAVFGGILASSLVPNHGWRLVFVVGGIAPLALAGALYALLPESIRFLALSPQNTAKMRSIARKLLPNFPAAADVQYAVTANLHKAGAIGALFRNELGPMTYLIWLISCASVMHLVFTVFWTPFVISAAGLGFAAVVWTNVAMLAGGCLGPIVLGLGMGRFNQFRIIALVCCGSVISLVGLTFMLGNLTGRTLFAFSLGFCVQGFQSGFVGISATLYPTPIRATGLGWSSGIGRLAAIISPIAGGYLVSSGLTPPTAYLSSAVLPVISLGTFLLLWAVVARDRGKLAEPESRQPKGNLVPDLE